MKKGQEKVSASQRGAVLVFVAIMLPMLVFLGGMALDFGRAYFYQSDIQNAADSAALAGVAAVANSGGKARLVSKEDIPLPINVADQEATTLAATVASQVLQMDMGGNQSPESKLFVMTKGDPEDSKSEKYYYYRVELSGNVALRFARIFLPDTLLPQGFPVKVQAIAMAKVAKSYGTMMEQINKMADEEFFNDFYDVEDYFKKRGFNEDKRVKAQQATFTNKGILYNADGTRSEVFNMDGDSEVNNDMKSLFVNYKADVQAIDEAHAFTYNWDVSDMWNMTAQEARNLFYDENGVATVKFTNWLLYDETPSNDPYVKGPHEGATITWDQFIRSYVNDPKTRRYQSEEEALKVLTSRISSIVNVTKAYKVRDNLESRPEDEVYVDADGNRNLQDPLFVRLESEEFNKKKGSYVTNSVRKIDINIQANNMGDEYRPMLFLYSGPADLDENYGVGRKSQVVTVNLEEDFKGAIYAPNSPVYINGNGHTFRGVIVAQSIVDSAGNVIPMPEEMNDSNADDFQTFYRKLNLSDATSYDDFGVIKLTNYKSIRKDVVFLTERASVTM